MGEKTVKPTIRQLSVILAKTTLADQENKNRKLLRHKIESTNSTISKQSASCAKKTSVTELKKAYKKHNIAYKQCKVVLEKLDLNKLKCAQDEKNGQKLVAVNENVKNDGVNLARQMVYDMPEKQLTEDKDDLYVFDEVDSESFQIASKAKRSRKKKVKSSSNFSKMNKKKHPKTKICNTYNVAMQGILQKVMTKINSQLKTKDCAPGTNKTIGKQNTNHLILLQKGISSHIDVNKSNSDVQITSVCDVKHLTPIHEDLLHIDNIDESSHDTEVDNENFNHLTPLREDLFNDNIDECNNDMEINVNRHTESHKKDEHISRICNSDKICFLYSPIRSNENVNIISNITLNGSDDSFSFFNDDLQPNANSTVLINTQRSPPWRFSDYVKRNPHYLSIKKTALPCLQQDMIIDHNQMKRIEENFAKVPKKAKKRGNKPSPIKDSGLFHDTIDKENAPQRNLFEMENFILTQTKSGINKQTRNILGPRVLNENNVNNSDINSAINDQENAVDVLSVVNKSPKLSDSEKSNFGNLENSENSLKEPTNTNFELRLFEDEEPVINFDENSKIYIPKARKKKKLYENIEDPSHEKHKREMTKKEEADLEKWAAKFNSLCDDIEKYNLEIE